MQADVLKGQQKTICEYGDTITFHEAMVIFDIFCCLKLDKRNMKDAAFAMYFPLHYKLSLPAAEPCLSPLASFLNA